MPMPDPSAGLAQYLNSISPALGNQYGAAMQLAGGGMAFPDIASTMQSPAWNQNRFAGGPLAPGFGPNAPGGGGKRDLMDKRGMAPPPPGAALPPPPRPGMLPQGRPTPQPGAKPQTPGPVVPQGGAPQQQGQQQMMMQLMQNPQFMQAIMPHIMRMFQGGPGGLAAMGGGAMGSPAH